VDEYSNFNCILHFLTKGKFSANTNTSSNFAASVRNLLMSYISVHLWVLEVFFDPGESCSVACFGNLLPWSLGHLARLWCYR